MFSFYEIQGWTSSTHTHKIFVMIIMKKINQGTKRGTYLYELLAMNGKIASCRGDI